MNRQRKNGVTVLKEAYYWGRLSLARRGQEKANKSPRLARANYQEQTLCSNRLTALLWQGK